jgi:hypothetical protein
VGASKHARSLDEIRTPRPQQICGLSPKEQPALMQGMTTAVRTMKLKHALGQIDAENVDFHRRPPCKNS